MDKKYNYDLKQLAKNLRKNMTREENHIWYDYLRDYPVKIYRQRPIGNYIADFCCSEAKLVIEIDGGQHYEKENMEYDTRRTKDLKSAGFDVIRFTNADIKYRFEGVCTMIDCEIKARLNR